MIIGGGFKALRSVLYYSAKIGPIKLVQTLTSKNACKACAFGTGGQNGGLHNETQRGIEICNKNIQAHTSDIRPLIPPQTFLQKSLAELSQLSGKELEDLGRLGLPLHKKAGDSHYRVLNYDEALRLCADKLRACAPARSFFYASGRSSNEAAFLLQLFARLYGTNNVNNCSYYCHQASGVALNSSIGTGTATVRYDDLEKCDCIFVFGANPASNHPRFVKALIKIRRRGGKVLIVNPAKEAGLVRFASPSDWRSMLKGGEYIASDYLQPHLGSDLALIQGLAKAVLENSAEDRDFIAAHGADFADYQAGIQNLGWDEIEASCGVPVTQIKNAAATYCQSEKTIFCWSMGLTHHLQGVHTLQALSSLALLRGMVGKEGAGLLPLRGHSNIQGTGSMGFTPALKAAVQEKIEQKLGHALPREAGLDTMRCMLAAAEGKMDFALCLGGNLLASNPDTQFASTALSNIPFKVFLNTTLNLSHVQGVDAEVLILPVRARDEERQSTTQESMFNFVRLSNGGIDRFPALRSEVELILNLAEKCIAPSHFDFSIFRSHQRLREFIGEVVPGFASLSDIDGTKQEFHIEGRTLHKPEFFTADGKAHFFAYPVQARDPNKLLLTTVRSEGQFNSIIYHNYDSYRDQRSRKVVMMNNKDMQRLGLTENQTVALQSATGKLSDLAVKAFDIREGNIMTYYPEANVLVPKAVDGLSGTPAFKSVEIEIIA